MRNYQTIKDILKFEKNYLFFFIYKKKLLQTKRVKELTYIKLKLKEKKRRKKRQSLQKLRIKQDLTAGWR